MDSSAYGRVMLFLCFGLVLPAVNASPEDYNNFVYKHCANQTFTDPTSSVPPILSSLFQELVLQSSKSKFFETNVGDDQTAILGRFQCRGDLSNDECHNCVNSLPKTSNSWCGYSVPARVQLSGCYIHYEADGTETSRLQLLHNNCSESTVMSSGFQELRDGAFAALESCVMNGKGFCDMNHESIHVTAQCEGNLEACDCGQCVASAAQIAQDECGYSDSGHMYLDNCFISYSNHYNGMPGNSFPEKGTGGSSGKLAAIAVGVIAAFSFGIALWYSIRSRRKTDDW